MVVVSHRLVLSTNYVRGIDRQDAEGAGGPHFLSHVS